MTYKHWAAAFRRALGRRSLPCSFGVSRRAWLRSFWADGDTPEEAISAILQPMVN